MIDLLAAPKSRTRIRAARVRSLAELFFRRLSQSTYARRREARRPRKGEGAAAARRRATEGGREAPGVPVLTVGLVTVRVP